MMRLRWIISPPGWSRWWATGALAVGFVLPSVLAVVVTVADYCSVGDALPRSFPWGDFGVVLVILGVSVLIIAAAVLYALLAWSWRPLALALIFALGTSLGLLPGTFAGDGVRTWAFGLFSSRSADLIRAIETYSQAEGAPPASLADLVPAYLPAIPTTGMAAEPDYYYVPKSGPCSGKNRWHLWVSVPQFIDLNRLLYCPQQDYASTSDEVTSRTIVGNWVHDEVDF